jgi:hypothetical protein
MFQQALARCEAGETGGIVVARLDRFARSAIDALSSIRRLTDAGARLVSVEGNFDGSTPMGRFAIGILILIAELELERIKSGWETAVGQAVRRGVQHLGAPADRLQARRGGVACSATNPSPPLSPRPFRRRATGASWAELARFPRRARGLPADRQQALVEGRRFRADQEPGLSGPGPQRQGGQGGCPRAARYPRRVRCRPISEEIALQAAGWLGCFQSDAGRAGPLRRLWAHAQDHRQHRSKERPALPCLLLHGPLRNRPLPGSRECALQRSWTPMWRSRC